MSVELSKVKEGSKTSKGCEFLKLTSETKGLRKLEKVMEKVIEFKELRRVRTLYLLLFVRLTCMR